MQVIGIFMLAEVLAPLREIAILNVFDRNMLPTFLLVSGNISSDYYDFETDFILPFIKIILFCILTVFV